MSKQVLAKVTLKERESSERLIKRWERTTKKLGIMDEIRGSINREPRKSLRRRAKAMKAEQRRRIEARKYRRNR
tara:strand:+ start:259 stop:480 length:222 start_codon:yes stop_codon:yes gene_type:complete